ncbi:MAG TPA: hypothetical protein VJY62_14860 [Bacteroidia bacterium]|nr:hypothetical protein [Bacteroidia bacterium]
MKKIFWLSFLAKSYLIVALGLTFSVSSEGQSYSQIIFDKQQSQYFGSCNLISLHNVLYSFEDKYIRDTLFNENNFIKKTAGIGYRIAKLLLLDAQADGLMALSQHEVFGHGARYREFGYKGNSFNLNLYPPFGNGSGFAQRGSLRTGYSTPTEQESIAINIGGVEGEMLLANNITSQILLDDTLNYREGLLYIITQNNLSGYLWSTRYAKPGYIKPGNDMNNYINGINYLYPHPPGRVYDIKKLSNQSLVSFANPFQIYAAFSIFWTYGIKGQKQLTKIPMIKFGSVRYLPAFNYSLTPFGSQYHFINYVRCKKILLIGDFSLGDKSFNDFYGISVKGFNIMNARRIILNFHLDVWNQPGLELEKYFQSNAVNKIGESFKIDIMLRPFNRQNNPGIFFQAGYKTKGYVMGEPLAKSFILRYGISMHL